jgi:predicted RND superfamily exporter protein
MTLRWGISNSEQFILVEQVLAELELDMQPLQELAAQDLSIRADIDSASDEYPVTWAIATGDPVTRYVAASSMQNQLQGTLVLGVLFCLITLWWGFRKVDYGLRDYSIRDLMISLPVIIAITSYIHLTVSSDLALGIGLLVIIGAGYWGTRALWTAIFTTIPIVIVIIWLYAIISAAGYGLNMVTVAIAAMSLGVGIDYVIHVVERYREERSTGANVENSIKAIGGAAGLALFGSAVSDVTGFLIISRSAMGFFASFGLFCAAMIALSLFASLVVTPAMLGAMSRIRNYNEQQVEGIRT